MTDPLAPVRRTSVVRLAATCAAGLAAACGTGQPRTEPAAGSAAAAGPTITGRLGDRVVTITIRGDTIAAVEPAEPDATVAGVLAPAVIDSHVHLAFWPVADALADHGVAAAVDLGAPTSTLGATAPPITVLSAGPILTQPSGYPLDAWGPDGFGLGCADRACVVAAVDQLADAGARVIKVALAADGLDPALVGPAVAAAHARGLRVAAHALGDREAALAAAAGVDVLAHAPIDRLTDATVAAWRGRAVISTLAAFGAPDAIDNLRRLRAAGATILYGTDLGNQRDDGPSPDELARLGQAGLDAPAIAAAMTTAPAAYWGLPRLGAIAPGAEASFVVLDADPQRDPTAILHPRQVWLRGTRR